MSYDSVWFCNEHGVAVVATDQANCPECDEKMTHTGWMETNEEGAGGSGRLS